MGADNNHCHQVADHSLYVVLYGRDPGVNMLGDAFWAWAELLDPTSTSKTYKVDTSDKTKDSVLIDLPDILNVKPSSKVIITWMLICLMQFLIYRQVHILAR